MLTLDSADQQPAAMVVLEALYATKPLPNLLAELPQGERLQVALLADMWELPSISAAAAGQLVEELNTAGQLSGPVTQQLLTSQALPSCLEPLVKVVLLSVYGDLEAVWADEALSQQMLGLPLHAIKLLLSCDRLKVGATHDAFQVPCVLTLWKSECHVAAWQQNMHCTPGLLHTHCHHTA